jgi:hypothetical protein
LLPSLAALAPTFRVRRKNWNIGSYRHSPIFQIINPARYRQNYRNLKRQDVVFFRTVRNRLPGVQIPTPSRFAFSVRAAALGHGAPANAERPTEAIPVPLRTPEGAPIAPEPRHSGMASAVPKPERGPQHDTAAAAGKASPFGTTCPASRGPPKDLNCIFAPVGQDAGRSTSTRASPATHTPSSRRPSARARG